ncbi:signal peptidase [Chryseobacterium lactis]|uniref:Signal peptidase n=1 Tax=Chryseobacterium lactis TaxID=1241981 RepID=A0A3G6RUZ0_CHRLC|nr:signal peptidase [Chryseobacterium lactis]AZA82021.1 signal peptidase [Chryseobacterium lactis]AZB07019.1 signal peptidase [Chryseobacterium lactis]PNW11034.1 signal peptidase [Chryseobacterium lactis]
MKTINKLVSAFFLLAVLFVQAAPPVPGGGGGTGGHGTGGGDPAAPIDMYVYVLSIVAIAFIVLFTKKYKNVKA